MNLELSTIDIYEKIPKLLLPTKKIFLKELDLTFKRTNIFLIFYRHGIYDGIERKTNLDYINPILWELGHIIYFWEHMAFKNLGITDLITDPEIYDSFKNKKEFRYNKNKLLPFNVLFDRLEVIKDFIFLIIEQYSLNQINYYLIRLAQLHHEMHNESFIFSLQLLDKQIFKPIAIKVEKILYDVEMIEIYGGRLNQGNNLINFYFDNEMPNFSANIEKFYVSKYCITNYQYLKFVKSNGYDNKSYWSEEGWNWKEKNKIKLPLYWKKEGEYIFEKNFGSYISLRFNNPVIHISWYEANAYCSWKNVRLLKESEWEYLASQKSPSLKNNAILDYGEYNSIKSTISVLDDTSENSLGIVGLFGNCWEWCQEPLYPYDGFKIDPVYREMSYPWFGNKRICRGGCWAVPDFLINKSYRNSQTPDCRHQYIGFRVAS